MHSLMFSLSYEAQKYLHAWQEVENNNNNLSIASVTVEIGWNPTPLNLIFCDFQPCDSSAFFHTSSSSFFYYIGPIIQSLRYNNIGQWELNGEYWCFGLLGWILPLTNMYSIEIKGKVVSVEACEGVREGVTLCTLRKKCENEIQSVRRRMALFPNPFSLYLCKCLKEHAYRSRSYLAAALSLSFYYTLQPLSCLLISYCQSIKVLVDSQLFLLSLLYISFLCRYENFA